jgi:hypothetical protein
MISEEDLKDLPKLSADDLALRLRDHFTAIGGLACAGGVEIGREAVRRARRSWQCSSTASTAVTSTGAPLVEAEADSACPARERH